MRRRKIGVVWHGKRLLRSGGRAIAWLRTRIVGRPIVLRDRRGLRWEIDADEPYAFVAGTPRWRRELTDDPKMLVYLERTLAPGDVVIDVGASIGVVTLLAAKLVGAAGTVVALEAERRNFAQLGRNVALNGFTNVETLHVAASDHDGEAMLSVYPRSRRGWHTLGPGIAAAGVAPIATEPVTCVTLDGLLAARGLARLDLLKIDVEGAEPKVLAGAQRALAAGTIRRIVFEVAPGQLRATGYAVDDVLRPLRAAGYAIAALKPDGGLMHMDAASLGRARFGNLVALAPGEATAVDPGGAARVADAAPRR